MGTRELRLLYPGRRLKEVAALDMTLMHILNQQELPITPISSPGWTMSAPSVPAPGKMPFRPIRRAISDPDTPSKDNGLHQLVSIRANIPQQTWIVLSEPYLNSATNNILHNRIRLIGTLLNNICKHRSPKRQKICLPLRSKARSLHNQRTLLHLQFLPTRRKTHSSLLSPKPSSSKSTQVILTTFLHCLRSALSKPP